MLGMNEKTIYFKFYYKYSIANSVYWSNYLLAAFAIKYINTIAWITENIKLDFETLQFQLYS